MPSHCVVPLCNNGGRHRFPKDPDLRQKWIIAIRRLKWEPSQYSRVCSSHFAEEDYSTTSTSTWIFPSRSLKVLKPGIVPSIFQWTKNEERKTGTSERQNELDAIKNVDIKNEVHPENSGSDCIKVSFNDLSENTKTTSDATIDSNYIENSDSDIGHPLNSNEFKPIAYSDNPVCDSGVGIIKQECPSTSANTEATPVPTSLASNPSLCERCKIKLEDGENKAVCIFKVKDKSTTFTYCLDCKDKLQLFECFMCREIYNDATYLRAHMSTHRELKVHECEICLKKFITERDLSVHKSAHDKVPIWREKAQNIVMKEKPTDTQSKKVNKVKTKLCSICFYMYIVDSTSLLFHRQDNAEPTHGCDVCLAKFVSACRLDLHRRSIHEDSCDNPYMCRTCRKEFCSPEYVKRHIVSHTEERPFACEICFKTFKLSQALRSHMTVHTDNRPHTCKVCKQSFKKGAVLNNHMAVHSEHKRFNCKICSKKFRFKNNLVTHMIRHSGEKPHLCDVCGKGFSLKHNLRVHFKTHGVQN